jgi:transposase
LKRQWCIPPEANAEFVAAMEDVLDTYTLPYDPEYPQVCMDESHTQLIGEKCEPLPSEPGSPERFDYEYVRNGVGNLFMMTEPLTGWRHVIVTERRTKVEWASAIQELVDVRFPNAKRIRLVMDNLNTHTRGALYEVFAPAEAKRILDKLEFHYTPKHGSWLNMAEIELSVLSTQCLNRRIPKIDILRAEVAAWEEQRNRRSSKIDWRFTTADARIKLKRLYPSIQG